jgi:hypothetical protein
MERCEFHISKNKINRKYFLSLNHEFVGLACALMCHDNIINKCVQKGLSH